MDKEDLIKQITDNLLKIKNKLKNNIIKEAIKKNLTNFDYEAFSLIIDGYLENQEKLVTLEDRFLKQLSEASIVFIENTNSESRVKLYKILLLDSINLLIDIYNEVIPKYKKQSILYQMVDTLSKISREEFSTRYDNLLNLLNNSEENSNLILYTKTENKPFKLFRNSNKSLGVIVGGDDNKISLTKERLINTVYEGQEYSHHKSYADVVIERILDNSIFDKIENEHNSSNIVDESLNKKISELENKNYELIGQISELKNMYEKRENEFSQVSEVLEKSKTLESEFYNAKEAVLKNIELKQATTYWEKQAINYNGKYKFYFWANIIIAVILIISAFFLINKSGLFIQNITVDNSNAIEGLKNLVQSVPFFNYVIFILYTTLVIWIMKILVKIMLSNYHLAVDANERVIMLNTYLILLEDGKGFEESDKKVILDNIFRQTNHGIIKDETSVTMADLVSSFKK